MEQQTLVVSVTGPLTKICGAVRLMVYRRMVLGASVAKVGVYGIPMVAELSSGFATSNPMEVYVHGFASLGENCFVGGSY